MKKTSLWAFVFSAIVLVAVLGIYLPGLHNELLFDDQRLVEGTIFEGYGSLLAFKQRMLSYGSFVWVQEVFGTGWWKQRLVNIALHLATVAALYALLRELLARVRFPSEFEASGYFEDSRTAALRMGVALFAVHPVAVYAVGYLCSALSSWQRCCACWRAGFMCAVCSPMPNTGICGHCSATWAPCCPKSMPFCWQ